MVILILYILNTAVFNAATCVGEFCLSSCWTWGLLHVKGHGGFTKQQSKQKAHLLKPSGAEQCTCTASHKGAKQRKWAAFCEVKVNFVFGKEKHVVREVPQQLSVNRGNGKIDMVALIDGLYSACVCLCLCILTATCGQIKEWKKHTPLCCYHIWPNNWKKNVLSSSLYAHFSLSFHRVRMFVCSKHWVWLIKITFVRA